MNWLRIGAVGLLELLAVFLHTPIFPQRSVAKAAAAPIPVKMGLPAFTSNSILYFIASEKGFYREEGLQVEMVLIPAALNVAATVSGEIEFNGAASTSIGAAMQGAPLKVVLVLSRKPKFWIFSKPEIQKLADLAGRTLASGSRGGDQYNQTLHLLERFGLAGKVRILIMPGAPGQASFRSLMTGQVDAAYANESTYFTMKEHGFRELINYADYLEAPSTAIVTSQKLIAAKPEIVQSFVNASYRGMLFFKERRSESIAMMGRVMKLDGKSAAQMYDLVINTYGGDGKIDYAPIRRDLAARKNYLNLSADIPSYEELFDDRFVRALQKQPRAGATP